MIKASVPVAKPAAPKVASAENKAAVKVLPSVQPMQLAAETDHQNSMEGFVESGPGKMAPSFPFQFKSPASIDPATHSPFQKKQSSTWAFQPNSVGANSTSTSPVQRAAAPANKTGLPDNVKSGVEQLSGISLGDVKVHYNSPKPAQLQAHAYAQGTDIHVASGQEKHVPHEAWHVVQQKQGRVQANTQLKGAVPVNDDAGLETEADVMGAKAVAQGKLISNITQTKTVFSGDVAQRAVVQFLFGFGEKKQNNDTNVAEQGKKTDTDNKADVKGDKALGVGGNIKKDSPNPTPPDGSTSESEGQKGAKITNNYTKSGFITEKASLRKTDVVNTIIENNKKDKSKAAKVIKSGVLPKDDGWFGLGLLGVKTENFELSDNFDPKKIGYLIPVKIDSSNEDSEIGWSPVMINYQFNEEAKLKLNEYKNEEGYVDTKKIIKSELDLNAKGKALTGKDNALGAAMNDSIVGKVVGFAINNSRTVRGMANEAVGGGLDVLNQGAEFIQKNALDKVKILSGSSFSLDKAASKITPKGSFITGKVSKDKWVFSSTFKVNTDGDYSAEYLGSVIENPPALELGNADAAFKLNFGSMVKHQANPNDPLINSTNGEASLTIMGQQVFAKWDSLDFSLTDYKVTKALFSQVGLNLNLSVGNIIKAENLTAAINNLSIADNKITHGDIIVSIDSVNILDVATFSNIKGSVGEKTGFSGEGDFKVTAPGLTNAQGRGSITKGPADKDAQYKLNNGAFNVDILGQSAAISGVDYDSKSNVFTIKQGNLNLNILGTNLNIEIENPSYTKDKGFDFGSAKATIPELVFADQAKMSNILVKVVKKGNEYTYDGASDFNLNGKIGGADASANGNVSISKEGQDGAQLKFTNANVTLNIFGQRLALTGVNAAQGEFEAAEAKAYINTPFMSESEVAIENLKINSAGYTFSKSQFNSKMEVDFGFLKANLASLAFEKTGSSWIVSGEGGLSAGGSKFFGYSLPSISGSGILAYDFGAKKTEKELKEVSVSLPGIEFPKAIGLPSEMGVSTEIPVLPGLNVVAKAGLRGTVAIPPLILSLNKKGDQVYEISAGTQDGTKATGEFFAYIAAGVGTGIPLIASVSLTLGAEGGISVGLSFSVSKEISLDKGGNIDLNSSSLKTNYQLSGDLSLAAFIELTGSAFFFSKSFRKELAKTSLGSFEKSNDEDFKWIKRAEPLQDENETIGDIKKNLKVDLTSAESKIWTAEQFKAASKKFYEFSDSRRVRIVAVDESLKAYDAIRDIGVDSDKKVKALNNLKVFIEKYLADTAGTSSRTESVVELWSQIQMALQELEKIPSKLLQ